MIGQGLIMDLMLSETVLIHASYVKFTSTAALKH